MGRIQTIVVSGSVSKQGSVKSGVLKGSVFRLIGLISSLMTQTMELRTPSASLQMISS